jgi:hypothetical protein
MNEIKVLCKDCKYFKEGKTSSSDLCIHPSSELETSVLLSTRIKNQAEILASRYCGCITQHHTSGQRMGSGASLGRTTYDALKEIRAEIKEHFGVE